MHQYIQASKYDRYKFMPDHLEYFHVSDEECTRKAGILPGEPTIILYADKNQKKHYRMSEESTGGEMQLSDIIKFVLNGMSKWNPTWNARSGALISEYAFNGLFFIEKSWPVADEEEGNLEWIRKWQSKMINRMIIKVQDEPNNEHIPIRVSYDEMIAYEKSVRNRTFKGGKPLPQLLNRLGDNLKPDSLPQILFLHGQSNAVSTYPKPLGDDNFHDNSEDLLDLW